MVISLVGINRKGGLTFARIEKTSVLRPVLQSKQGSRCGLHSGKYRKGGGPNGQIVSIKKLLTEVGRGVGRSLMKRKKRAEPRTDPGRTP